MVIFTAFFEKDGSGKAYKLQGQYLKHFKRAFPDYESKLKQTKTCIAYFVGKENKALPVYSLGVKAAKISKNEVLLEFEKGKKRDIASSAAAKTVRRIATQQAWADETGLAPLVCILDDDEAKRALADMRRTAKLDAMLEAKDYKGICMSCRPLGDVKNKPEVWDDADTLYALGLACSKLSVTLLVKAGEKKKLENAKKYRDFCVAFLERGAQIEQGNARFATALAYRYYSNVHELMRPGERRDSDLETEMEKANEWLSKSIEMNPQSVRNHYRKGKLIIEKQAPYLLFGKKAFGQGEATLLRDIRTVGVEHLETAVSLYESGDASRKAVDKREYAKALFVLGRHYLSDANLPTKAYFFAKIAGDAAKTKIEKISKLDLESARENLEKCFAAETDMPMDKPDIGALAAQMKEWTRTPVEKLYQIGCVYSGSAFVHMAEGKADKAAAHAKKAIALLEAAKKTAEAGKDRKRNTWHISDKIAWTHIYMGEFGEAARLLSRARAGYIVNTYAIAMLLAHADKNAAKAAEVLKKVVRAKHNLAAGTSQILYAFTQKKLGEAHDIDTKEMSEKNVRLGRILGVIGEQKNL